MKSNVIMILRLLALLFRILIISGVEQPPGNLTDVSICKMSHLGVEYLGQVGKTESGVRCQSWAMNSPHKVRDDITDDKFMEGSKKRAKNYCRNPDRNPTGPWCYTMNDDLSYEGCALPLCSFSQCKVTGPGMEYAGQHHRGTSDRKCLKWDKDRKKVKTGRNYTKISKFNHDRFPDERVSDAKKFCRNPDGDPGGPWCFVEDSETGDITKEYCDVPFCDDPECSVLVKDARRYTHYTGFDKTLTNITFEVKLWDSDSFHYAQARLVLSLFALPLTGREIHDAGIGIEVIIGNNFTALRYGNKDQPEYEPTPGILKSYEYTKFDLSWHAGFLTLGLQGDIKPIFLAEIRIKNNLMGAKKNQFNYYSVQGTNVLWNFPFCLDDSECDIHTTTGGDYEQFWPMREKEQGHDLHFHLRAHHSAYVLVLATPAKRYPHVKIMFKGSNNITRITLKEYEGEGEIVIKEFQLEKIVDYWEWNQFSLLFFADSFEISMKKEIGMHSLVKSKNEVYRNLRWFSVRSENSVAHWSFYCSPPVFSNPPPSVLPECALNSVEPNYKGTQDITAEGLPCVPWAATKLIPETVPSYFQNESVYDVWNFCRDPLELQEGTYCYAVSLNPETKIEKTKCHLRKCKSEHCKMAGTGNDYIGQLSVTRSNRTCDFWDIGPYSVHPQKMSEYNGSLFADMNSTAARNYCRNPTRDVSGSWCYTKDPAMVQDVCNIRDCEKPEECIIIIGTYLEGRKIYILPQWKESGLHGGLRFALKEWNPNLLDGVVFYIYAKDTADQMQLHIGANFNEKLIFYYNGVIKEEKVFPHLLSAGKWTSFWLQMRRGEIMFGFEGVPTTLLEWKHPNMDEAFEPVFMNYASTIGGTVAIFFKCEECHTENTTINSFLKFFPIGLWSQEELPSYRNITIWARGVGIAWVSLMWVTNNLESWLVSLDATTGAVGISKVELPPHSPIGYTTNLAISQIIPQLMTTNSWTKFEISWTEKQLRVKRNDVVVLVYDSVKPIVAYWFSMAAASGWIVWSANCEPVDLDGPPRDGGWSKWSPWKCSVSCDGGEGYRTRTCSNPRPNVFGRMCEGSPTSTGKCNDFPCGDISPETLDEIREHLRQQKHSYLINQGSSVTIKNDQKLLKIVARESPKAYYEWTLNGVYIQPETNRVEHKSDDIFIRKAMAKDSGVYACVLVRINKKRVVLRVVTLAVVSDKYDVETRATRPYTLVCNSVVLGYIYSDISMKLVLNDETFIDHGITTLAAVNTHSFDSLNMSLTGDWKCVLEQNDLGLDWVTNYVRINVKNAPTLYTNLMEDDLTRPLFSWLKTETNVLVAVIFIVIFVILMVVVFLVMYFKFCTFKSRHVYKRNRRE